MLPKLTELSHGKQTYWVREGCLLTKSSRMKQIWDTKQTKKMCGMILNQEIREKMNWNEEPEWSTRESSIPGKQSTSQVCRCRTQESHLFSKNRIFLGSISVQVRLTTRLSEILTVDTANWNWQQTAGMPPFFCGCCTPDCAPLLKPRFLPLKWASASADFFLIAFSWAAGSSCWKTSCGCKGVACPEDICLFIPVCLAARRKAKMRPTFGSDVRAPRHYCS